MRPHRELDGADDAPAVVLGASLGTSTAMWDPQVPALAERMRVVRFDLPGHGDSPAPPGPYSLSELAGGVLELLDELAIDRCSYCGVSLGGMVGLWLAARAPERIARLVVCASSPYLPPGGQWSERARAVRESGSVEVVADAVLERWLTPSFAAEHPDMRARLRAVLVASDPVGYAGWCEAIAGIDLREDLRLIGAPTLVICGAEDPVAPPLGHGELIAAGVQHGRLSTLSPGAHLVSVERAPQVNELIADHLMGNAKEEEGW
jgi:3-oxoadipate enol-lactonase